jgi:hypothetical protein
LISTLTFLGNDSSGANEACRPRIRTTGSHPGSHPNESETPDMYGQGLPLP